MSDRPLKIALANVHHSTVGRHSACMPINLGYLASYTISQIGKDRVEISLHDDPEEVLSLAEKGWPDLIGMSNYCWNAELGRTILLRAKEVHPDVITVGGGPEFPIDADERREYLRYRSDVDLYVYHEGEVAFAGLIEKIREGIPVHQLRSTPPPGVVALHPETGELVSTPPPPRMKNLDEIPSPYLSGIMDRFFDMLRIPMIESARGCPYSCTYCSAGAEWYNKVHSFSVERVKSELDYLAEHYKDLPDIRLSICDSNFGMLKRDEEISKHIRALRDRYGWPKTFYVTMGKSQVERLVRVAADLKIELPISPQSMNPNTVEAIKRKNLGGDKVENLYSELRSIGIKTYADLIMPLPKESKQTLLDGFRKLSQLNIHKSTPFTTMMLKGTELSSKETRQQYGIVTKWRLVPMQFGEYRGRKVFEPEEVCVATDTMPFEDYLECRGFIFVFNLLMNDLFDVFERHIHELGIERFAFFLHIWEKTKSGATALSDLYDGFIRETKSELFDSKEDLFAVYSQEANYEALLQGKIGDNVMRKYCTAAMVDKLPQVYDLGYEVLHELMGEDDDGRTTASLSAAANWLRHTRDPGPLMRREASAFEDRILELDYDVESWYATYPNDPLVTFDTPSHYRTTVHRERIEKAIDTVTKLHGNDMRLWSAKLLITNSLKYFRRRCEAIH